MRIKLEEEKGKPFSEKITDFKLIDSFPPTLSRQSPHRDWLDYRNETIKQQEVEKMILLNLLHLVLQIDHFKIF